MILAIHLKTKRAEEIIAHIFDAIRNVLIRHRPSYTVEKNTRTDLNALLVTIQFLEKNRDLKHPMDWLYYIYNDLPSSLDNLGGGLLMPFFP